MDSPTQAFTSQQNREIESAIAAGTRMEPTRSHSPSTTQSLNFLQIVPHNTNAKCAFSEMVDQLKANTLGRHHAQYIVDAGKGPLTKNTNYQLRSEGETTDEDESSVLPAQEINLGLFRISFDSERVMQAANWAMGRGSVKKSGNAKTRNVDILLAVPGSRYTKGLLPAHAYLRMHPDSGVWMIQAAPESSDRSQEVMPRSTVTLDDEDILDKEFQCLTKPEMRLTILDLEFIVRFVPRVFSECERYRQLRNRRLEDLGLPVPDTLISGIPLDSDIRVSNLAIGSQGLGSGASALVWQAFDPRSGDLRAIKVLEIKNESVGRLLKPEISMVLRYSNTRGLIRQYGWSNSNGDQILDVKVYPLLVYIVQRKGTVFYQHEWGKTPELERVKLCQDLLYGLLVLHDDGYIHRDITRQNILYCAGSPPQAALCDFGKVHEGRTDTNTALAAWSYLPPEIIQWKENEYNQSIDIWMLALALISIWFPEAVQDVPRRHSNNQITTNGIMLIRSRLKQVNHSEMAGLLRDMLSEDPDQRPRAKDALLHLCFHNLKTKLADAAESRGGKRHLPDYDEIEDTL